jgi:hypothetical protein
MNQVVQELHVSLIETVFFKLRRGYAPRCVVPHPIYHQPLELLPGYPMTMVECILQNFGKGVV